MDNGSTVVIFASYAKRMKRVIICNEGLFKRVTKYFYFDNLTTLELGEVALLKMNATEVDVRFQSTCITNAVAQPLDVEITEKQRQNLDDGLVWPMLINVRENLDHRLRLDCCVMDELVITTLEDLSGLG
ncbi:hypothetical protein L7F22_016649 [Adiantum nelumboides]|nr:hypothetical protein [Adiantum nelumboides]